MWKNQYGDTFETEFDARLDASEMMDSNDILEWIVGHYPASIILAWMGDNGIELMMKALGDYFNENYNYVEDETNEG